MTARTAEQDVPQCPFCGAPWTSAMRSMFEHASFNAGCACCTPGERSAHLAGPLQLPAQDLCCASCGKAIYRAALPAAN